MFYLTSFPCRTETPPWSPFMDRPSKPPVEEWYSHCHWDEWRERQPVQKPLKILTSDKRFELVFPSVSTQYGTIVNMVISSASKSPKRLLTAKQGLYDSSSSSSSSSSSESRSSWLFLLLFDSVFGLSISLSFFITNTSSFYLHYVCERENR